MYSKETGVESTETDTVLYRRGNEYRRQGNWKRALECYAEAISLNPESPAVQARELLLDILNFRNPDMYNP
ncbi:MAG: tetratricopeptide repeat protein [Bacteroidaceae bacterium]|nr:tetratricopeptide repeat protein [Bacteroidaceae bacterium]